MVILVCMWETKDAKCNLTANVNLVFGQCCINILMVCCTTPLSLSNNDTLCPFVLLKTFVPFTTKLLFVGGRCTQLETLWIPTSEVGSGSVFWFCFAHCLRIHSRRICCGIISYSNQQKSLNSEALLGNLLCRHLTNTNQQLVFLCSALLGHATPLAQVCVEVGEL